MNILSITTLVLTILIAGLFIFASFSIFSRKTNSVLERKSSIGLGIVLFCWASLATLIGLDAKASILPALVIIWNSIAWLGLISSICIATIVLLDFSDFADDTRSKHKRYAKQTLLLAFIFMLATGGYVFNNNPALFKKLFMPGDTESSENISDRFENYTSDHFYFSVTGRGSKWKHWKGFEQKHKYAEMGLRQGDNAYFVVIPFFIRDEMPEPEKLVKATAPFAGINPEAPWKGKWARQQHNGFEGFVFDFEQKVQAATYSYKMKTYQNEHFSYVVAAWSNHENTTEREALLNNIHNRTQIQNISDPIDYPNVKNLSPRESKRHSQLFENIAQEYLKEGNTKQNIKYLKKAHGLNEDDSKILGSIIYAYMSEKNFKAASAYLQRYLEAYPESEELFETLRELDFEEQGAHDEEPSEMNIQALQELVGTFGDLPAFKFAPIDPAAYINYDNEEYQSPYSDEDGRTRDEEGSNQASQKHIKRGSFGRPNQTHASESQASSGLSKGMITEKLIHSLYFEPGTPLRFTEKRSLKFETQEAVNNSQFIHFNFFSDEEKIQVRELTVRDNLGKIVQKGNKKNYATIDGLEANSSKSALNITIEELKIGYSVDTFVEWQKLKPASKFNYFEYSFANATQTKTHKFFFYGKPDAIHFVATPDVKTFTSNDQIKWVYKHKGGDAKSAQATGRIWIGSKDATWEDEVLKATKALKRKIRGTAEISRFAKQLTRPASNKDDKIRMILNYVHQTLTTSRPNISLTNHLAESRINLGEITDQLDSILLSLYAQKMLSAISIKSYLAGIRKDGVLQEEIPSLEQINYTLLYLPEFEGGSFFDIASKQVKLGKLSATTFGQKALIFNPKDPRFKKLKAGRK